jgi:Holliday junction resolvase RusA-like endonuclease
MSEIKFYVSGEPKGQPRPRAFALNGKARVFDPGTAEGWKSCVAMAAKPYIPHIPINQAVELSITFLMPRPKKHFDRSGLKTGAPCFFTKKPDTDNLAKAVMDALTILGMWTDDALVCDLTSKKRYSNTGTAGASINIKLLDEPKEE